MTYRESKQLVVIGSKHTWDVICLCWQFCWAPLVEGWQGISLVRLIAAFCMVLVGHEVFVHEHDLTWVDFWIVVAAVAAAFGKKVFSTFLISRGRGNEIDPEKD